MSITKRVSCWFAVVGLAVALTGCAALQEIANLRSVDFAIDRVTNAHLAGVDLDRASREQNLRQTDLLSISRAIAGGRAPFDFTLNIMAENPAENNVRARMVEMDWTLYLDDRETVSGIFSETVILEPGEPTEIAMDMGLDLVEFFDGGVQDIVDLALAVSGYGGEPRDIRLEATPTIETRIGPIRYPRPISITVGQVGG